MTDTDTDLSAAFEEATAAAERAYAEREDDSLPEGARNELRESSDRVASAAADASVAELLSAAGVEDVPDDAAPVDLPAVMRDADAGAIVSLRRLLQLADLGESWDETTDEGRIDRLDAIVGDADESEGESGFAQLEEYLEKLGHLVGGDADEEATPDDGAEGTDAAEDTPDETRDGGADGTDESDESEESDGDSEADDELLELEEHLGRLEALVGGDDADGESDDGEEETGDGADDDGPMSTGRSSGRFSTVPASRSDTGSTGRFSTVRGRK